MKSLNSFNSTDVRLIYVTEISNTSHTVNLTLKVSVFLNSSKNENDTHEEVKNITNKAVSEHYHVLSR